MKLKETITIALAGLVFMLITGIAKSDEKTITPQEFGKTIMNNPEKYFTEDIIVTLFGTRGTPAL